MTHLNQFLPRLYQIYKNLLEKVRVGNIDLVKDHTINVSKYNPLAGSDYIKLPKELDHTKKVRLIFKVLMIMNG